ncbi:MAG: hypothetical protein NT118_00695 [Lentisphaerae bacterium]|nr:hypothetical protein [Lentisphaerota bacterium]
MRQISKSEYRNPKQGSSLKVITGLLVIFLSASFSNGGESDSKSYLDLDKNIVKAYNSNPRNTAEVYANSMLILEKSSKEEDSNGAAWQLKARKLVTISCFYECTQAIDKKLYRQAYVWAKRGEENGTTFGKIGEVPVKNLYDYLTFASKELKEIPVVKNSRPEELSMQIENHDGRKMEMELQALISSGAVLTSRLESN